jgi:hypothetical protein
MAPGACLALVACRVPAGYLVTGLAVTVFICHVGCEVTPGILARLMHESKNASEQRDAARDADQVSRQVEAAVGAAVPAVGHMRCDAHA